MQDLEILSMSSSSIGMAVIYFYKIIEDLNTLYEQLIYWHGSYSLYSPPCVVAERLLVDESERHLDSRVLESDRGLLLLEEEHLGEHGGHHHHAQADHDRHGL